ncbi:uncharacterized protein EI90DRAFT_3020599 [Cantharellus anzutake]|uniref:uncharacterized protein n=1 Tax=Cantharellus anzutake TaxID=1750568 RepID=UPI00190603FF|nr:uncharacterized protein EI90DRAFT_3020599 [Cantharellus anzutake]KAF8319888.1 hypothetical protein EI90DRAFT_3020599 [Cantharellus anzutake]
MPPLSLLLTSNTPLLIILGLDIQERRMRKVNTYLAHGHMIYMIPHHRRLKSLNFSPLSLPQFACSELSAYNVLDTGDVNPPSSGEYRPKWNILRLCSVERKKLLVSGHPYQQKLIALSAPFSLLHGNPDCSESLLMAQYICFNYGGDISCIPQLSATCTLNFKKGVDELRFLMRFPNSTLGRWVCGFPLGPGCTTSFVIEGWVLPRSASILATIIHA